MRKFVKMAWLLREILTNIDYSRAREVSDKSSFAVRAFLSSCTLTAVDYFSVGGFDRAHDNAISLQNMKRPAILGFLVLR